MPIIPSIIKWLNTKRIDEIELFKTHPVETQEETLYKLLAKASLTEWGVKYGYSSISSVREYQSRFPIQTYEDLIPFVERLRKGESNLLWPGEIKWFAKSSGTTSTKSKFIPMSNESLEECQYRAAKDILAIYTMNNPGTRFYNGKALTLGGSHKVNPFSSDSLYGDLSAIMIENAPSWVELIRTPRQKIALIEDFEKKLELITKSTINENVTSFSGVPSWYLTLIKYILAYTGKSNLLEVWPNLEVFFHGGISFTPYREIYRKLIKSDQMHYMETYNASEGFFGIQDDPSKSDMLLMLDYGIYYEFIPADKIDSDSPPVYTIGDVEPNVNYAMIISTNGGLWRYMIGDTIVFTGTYPHRFRITGRTRQFINAFGEEVIVDNADKALEAACKATGAIISEYTAGPVYMSKSSRGSHEWIIEFEKEPDDINLFTSVLDDTLKSINSDYEAKRFKDINLIMPVIRKVPAGTFNEWLKSKGKLGGQNKVPRLANSREFIEDIYFIAGITNE
ncbi:MAG TPA: GH3 auxin-responsive promoter family protein [Bacteroidales bacterium]|nr:GH3 auxin-responsive promoter family protein [Bacteroidales bacterium]HPT21035.1 GH3 auxin-responsive promoter family protein [Bacteroidales bacterium]